MATELRTQFVARFPLTAWPELPLETYALGQQVEGGSVGWWLEFHSRPVASMSGGNATKHLIWRGSDGDWRYPRQYASVEEAWSAVRAGFVEVFRSAAERRFDEIDDVEALEGSALIRSKALYMYFPDDLVPVCS